MRKVVLGTFVLFTTSVFALGSVAQRRRHDHGHAIARAADPPQSPRIATELGAITWGSSHDQVVAFYRTSISARYQPQLRNKGQVEQDRLMEQRDQEINDLRASYIPLDGRPAHQRWDTSFVGSEYTQNNGESLLVHENPQTGDREFFFFFNDHLWKRVQARVVPTGRHLTMDTFAAGLESLFGPGLHTDDPAHPDHQTVMWQDANTRLRVVDNTTFYNVFCLIYEQKATLARLAELRHNTPANVQHEIAKIEIATPQVGNVAGDSNEDIVDRMTGKMRRVQNAQAGSSAAGSTGGTAATPSGGTTAPAGGSNGGSTGSTNSNSNDPLSGI